MGALFLFLFSVTKLTASFLGGKGSSATRSPAGATSPLASSLLGFDVPVQIPTAIEKLNLLTV